jgi:hypothetical protein
VRTDGGAAVDLLETARDAGYWLGTGGGEGGGAVGMKKRGKGRGCRGSEVEHGMAVHAMAAVRGMACVCGMPCVRRLAWLRSLTRCVASSGG